MQPMQLLFEWHAWTHRPKSSAQTAPSRQAPKLDGVFLQVHRQQVLHFLLNPNISSDFIYSCTQSWIQMMVRRNVMDALLWTALMTPGSRVSPWPQCPGHLSNPFKCSCWCRRWLTCFHDSSTEDVSTSRVLAAPFMETSLDIRKNLFPMRTVKQWNRLPTDLVQSLSSEDFKTQLDKALCNLVWPQGQDFLRFPPN